MRRFSLSQAVPKLWWVVGLCLCACHQDPVHHARWAALELVASQPQQAESALPELLRMVDDPRPAWRVAGQAALLRMGPYHAAAVLDALCDVPDASPEYRSALRTALRNSGAEGAQALLARWRDPGHSNLRELGTLLAQLGLAALAPLRAALDDADVKIQLSAIWTLGQMKSAALELVPELITLAHAPHAASARQAVQSLVLIAPTDDRVLACLEVEVRAVDPMRQAWALEALASTEFVRVRLAPEELWQRYGAHALVPAIEACASTDPARRALANATLDRIWDPAAQALWGEERALLELLRDLENEFPATRAQAALQLGLRSADRAAAIAALRTSARDAHAGVAACAQRALRQLGAEL